MSAAIKVLSFESSCDDTSVALLEAMSGERPKVLGLAVQSQDEVHSKYGGVVPELASRAHLDNLLPCLRKVLDESDCSLKEIDLFVATARPGLIGSLLVGHTAAKSLAYLFDKAFVSVNHLEGHMYSIFLEKEIEFPYLALVVSGGHTSLYRVDSFETYETLGLTLDDAAGEAFDKAAKLLGLGFPGGAELETLAKKGDSNFYSLAKVNATGLNFSFSGLKSEFSRLVKRESDKLQRENAAASYQSAILNHLESQIRKSLQQTGLRQLCIVGGVARNQALRSRLLKLQEEDLIDSFFAPSPVYCTDNAAMIGFVGYRRYLAGRRDDLTSDVGSTSRPSRLEIRRAKQA